MGTDPNNRLRSYRRGVRKQLGHVGANPPPYYPSRQQDVLSARAFVDHLTKEDKDAALKNAVQKSRGQETALKAAQALAAPSGVIRCQNLIWTVNSNAPISTPVSIVPQNFNRVFLLFCAAVTNPTVITWSFGRPLAAKQVTGQFSGIHMVLDTTSGIFDDEIIFNSTVIPTDEIFVAANVGGCDIWVYEGVPIS